MSYAELFAISNFTFLTGASHPEEMVERAAEFNLDALAITDRNSFAGIVRGHAAAKQAGIRYIVGVCLALADAVDILAYPKDRTAYGRLCRMLTIGKRRATKGGCDLFLRDVLEWGEGSVFVVVDGPDTAATAGQLATAWSDDVYIGLAPCYDGEDERRFANGALKAEQTGVPPVALGNVLMHKGNRRALADVLSCIREKTTIDMLGRRALPNSERRLKSEFEMRRMFKDHPLAIQNTVLIAEHCRFSLDQLKYEYPDEITNGLAPGDRLRSLIEAGLTWRYPRGVPLKVQAMVKNELALIDKLDYARYFLTVHDIVKFARSRNILCQGRGSAANSVVGYALGITEASPDDIAMVFARFVSDARNEPPDIDVDFEHERREEVIQHVYDKFGRHRAGLCSTIIHFRSRSAIRAVGKAMGLSEDAIAAMSNEIWGSSSTDVFEARSAAAGGHDPRFRKTMALTRQIIGFPRHLSQHVGGFVITRDRLDELCPIGNAAMDDRTVIEWDKDDVEVLGMLKIDILALGMLSCLRKAFNLLRIWKGLDYTLATLPQDDPAVYDMLCAADTVGVFQVESRAQMTFLPRMRPRTFYDLVIEVAIIRPGPIQGDMVHPFIKRRRGEEPVTFPSKALEDVLDKTLGVPLFQEQAMQIASVAAGFSASEADALRRALGSFRGPGSVENFRTRFIAGCLDRGYDQQFAENCFRQLEGFSGYGFPESHAASFARLVYASACIKCHHPEIFCCALLNAQPMGFYASAQIVRDARAHDVPVLPICAERSYWDNVLEIVDDGALAVRLGFRQIKGFCEEDGLWLASARGNGYRDIETVWRRAGISRPALAQLAAADAFAEYGLNRREAQWAVKGLPGDRPLPLFERTGERLPELPIMTRNEEVFEDYVAMRMTLRDHPVTLLRPALPPFRNADILRDTADSEQVCVIGLVIARQRPGTASGVIFMTLEDDTAVSDIVIWPKIFTRFRKAVLAGRLLHIRGTLQREGPVTHVIALHIDDCSDFLDRLGTSGHVRDDDRSSDKPPTEAITLELQRSQQARYSAGARHPREQARKLFYSRDFH